MSVQVDLPKPKTERSVVELDIEHAVVDDDPRQWSAKRKKSTLAMVATAAMIATLGANIYNPAIQQVMDQLRANNAEIALSLSLYILAQGGVPLLWAAVSEIKGRKACYAAASHSQSGSNNFEQLVYLISLSIYAVACAICGASKSIGLLIGMRVLQASGGAAVLTIGAGTLADIFEPQERGTMLGIYYAAPLLGPAIGPLLGGILTQVWNWRATFYFLSILGGVLLLPFAAFRDTFRRERSLSYQAVVTRLRNKEHKKLASVELQSGVATPRRATSDANPDLEQASVRLSGAAPPAEDIRLSLADVNPFPQLWLVLARKNNVVMLFPSGLLFALGYSITYTCSKTLVAPPYNYNALHVGFVLLSFGLGVSMAGSVLGGRWSDRVLSRLKTANGGTSYPEMRLEATKLCMPILPLSVLAYAWLAQEHVHISGLVVALFFAGFGSIWIYSSTLAYVVDANIGRSSTAVATNSFARGCAGFIAAEAAVPLQMALGDGGLYTIWAGLCVILELVIFFVIRRGGKWRQQAEIKEKQRELNQFR